MAFSGSEVEIVLGDQEGDAVAHHHGIARVDRIAEPAGRAGHRHQPVDGGNAAQGRRHDPVRSSRRGSSPTSPRGRRSRSRRSTSMLKDIRAGKGTVGKLFTDDDLYREINKFVISAQEVAATLSNGQGTLGLLIKDPAAYNRLNTRAQQPAGDDRADQRRRGLARPAAQGRRAGEIADVGVRATSIRSPASSIAAKGRRGSC